MSSKRKSLPSKVLESFADSGDMLVDSASDDVTHPSLPLLATPEHSDSSAPGSDYSTCGREDSSAPTSSPARWGDLDVTNSDISSKRCRRENSVDMDDINSTHLPSFNNPFLQARLQEARLQQEHARLLQEAALRHEHHNQQQRQQHNLHFQQQIHHQNHLHQHPQQQLQTQSQQQNQEQQQLSQTELQHPNHHPQTQQQQQSPNQNLCSSLSTEDENVTSLLASRKSMDEVLKKLTSKMVHSSIDDSERGKQESTNGSRETKEPNDSSAPTSTTSPTSDALLGSLSHLIGADPEALKSQEKRITDIIGQLQKLRESIRSQQEPQQEKVEDVVKKKIFTV